MGEQAKESAQHIIPKVQKKLKPLSEISAARATLEDVRRAAKESPPDCSFLSKVLDPNQTPPAKPVVAKAANDAKNTPGICSVAVWSDKTSDTGSSTTSSEHGTKDSKNGAKGVRPMSAQEALELARKAAGEKKK